VEYIVNKVLTPCIIQLKNPWSFYGVEGYNVFLVGIRSVPDEEKGITIRDMESILVGEKIELAEQWLIRGRTLHAIVNYQHKPIWKTFPKRRTYFIEPSRKLNPYDHVDLVRVSGGLPSMWINPLPNLELRDDIPHFEDVYYPTKWWLPNFSGELGIVRRLYCKERNNKSALDRQFNRFFYNQTKSVLNVFGECGIGKSWYVIHQVMEDRPPNSDYAYIDLRGRPMGPELAHSIHRELGEFLDQYINKDLDPIKALAHYLIPIALTYFDRDKFDPDGFPERQKMKEALSRIALDPKYLTDYNDIRLKSYENLNKKLFIIIDNVDNYSIEDQETVFDCITRILSGRTGVNLIIPLRPTSVYMVNRLQQTLDKITTNMFLYSPKIRQVLNRRFSCNSKGNAIDLSKKLSLSKLSLQELLDKYFESEPAGFLMDLCSNEQEIPSGLYAKDWQNQNKYDCRHYIRLFRRLITSDIIEDFENITKEYYAVHALMLKPGEPLQPQSAYLLNLFDNENPESPGNALIRYRVLEYFHTNTDIREFFDLYFRAIGAGMSITRDVVDLFIGAGLLIPNQMIDMTTNRPIVSSVSISCAGRAHYSIIKNIWYGICVKTGMHFEPNMIKRKEEAINAAQKEIYVTNPRLLKFYGDHGWISDNDFIAFLYKQQDLESRRIGEFEANEPNVLPQIAANLSNLSSPGDILSVVYGAQFESWQRKGELIR